MKQLKVLILALAVVGVLMAVGAGTASATALCSTATSPCTGTKYAAGTEVKSNLKEGTEAVITAGFATLKCTGSTMNWKVSNAGGSGITVRGQNQTVTLTGCNCTVTVLVPGESEVHYTSGSSATITILGTSITINCSGVS